MQSAWSHWLTFSSLLSRSCMLIFIHGHMFPYQALTSPPVWLVTLAYSIWLLRTELESKCRWGFLFALVCSSGVFSCPAQIRSESGGWWFGLLESPGSLTCTTLAMWRPSPLWPVQLRPSRVECCRESPNPTPIGLNTRKYRQEMTWAFGSH